MSHSRRIVRYLRFDDEYFADPRTVVGDLLESGPVHRFQSVNGTEGWLIVGAREARAALVHPDLEKSRASMVAGGGRPARSRIRRWGRDLQRWAAGATVSHMLAADPPDHARLRRVAATPFTANAVRQRTADIQSRADALVAHLGGRECDLVAGLAFPLPMSIICEILGIPPSRVPALARASAVLGDVIVAERSELREATWVFVRNIAPLLARRLLRPGGGDDLITQLAHEIRRRNLTFFEGLSTASLLLIAGHETTSSLIAHTLLRVLSDDSLRSSLTTAADPELLDGIIEETVRMEPPLPVTTLRRAVQPVEIGGVRIKAGDWVMVSLLGAAIDPAAVDEPDSFNPLRHPSPHMGFGHGAHHCLGSHLARAETRAAVLAVLRNYPEAKLPASSTTALSWRRSIVFHQLTRLTVELEEPTHV